MRRTRAEGVSPLLWRRWTDGDARSAVSGNSVKQASHGNVPVGLLPNASYERARCQLKPGDRVLLVTGGAVTRCAFTRDLYRLSGPASGRYWSKHGGELNRQTVTIRPIRYGASPRLAADRVRRDYGRPG
jgi:hypothetical protein